MVAIAPLAVAAAILVAQPPVPASPEHCDHCHIEGLWGDESKYQKLLTFKMLSLFEEIPTYFETSRQPNLQCFLCHQGKVKPEREPAP